MATPPNVYSLDTSALLDGLERFYLPGIFKQLWVRVDELLDEGRLVMSEEAWHEACRLDKPAKDWCTIRKNKLVVPTDASIALTVSEIGLDHPSWVSGTSNGADPFVIAVAEARGAIVLTGEKYGGPVNPKIPYVCDGRGTPHMRFLGMIEAEGWSF